MESCTGRSNSIETLVSAPDPRSSRLFLFFSCGSARPRVWNVWVPEQITGDKHYSAPSQDNPHVRWAYTGQLTSLERKGSARSQVKRESVYFGALIHIFALSRPRPTSLAPSSRAHMCFRIILIMRDETFRRIRRSRDEPARPKGRRRCGYRKRTESLW